MIDSNNRAVIGANFMLLFFFKIVDKNIVCNMLLYLQELTMIDQIASSNDFNLSQLMPMQQPKICIPRRVLISTAAGPSHQI